MRVRLRISVTCSKVFLHPSLAPSLSPDFILSLLPLSESKWPQAEVEVRGQHAFSVSHTHSEVALVNSHSLWGIPHSRQ